MVNVTLSTLTSLASALRVDVSELLKASKDSN